MPIHSVEVRKVEDSKWEFYVNGNLEMTSYGVQDLNLIQHILCSKHFEIMIDHAYQTAKLIHKKYNE